LIAPIKSPGEHSETYNTAFTMSEKGRTAYITGAASGIGRAIAEMLVLKGARVFLADINAEGAEAVAAGFNKSDPQNAQSTNVDVGDWNSQAEAFGKAVHAFGRIDYVYPIAGVGERSWTPNDPTRTSGFEKPDLTVIDLDLTGVMYTVSLAVQQFRRQEPEQGFRGKIGCVASVCGFYCVPTLPIYTAAKHGVNGFVRSFGKYLPEEQITMNAVSPNVIRTNISTGAFYDSLDAKKLLTPMKGLIDAFETMLGENDTSGEIFEIPPNGKYNIRKAPEYLDAESEEVCKLLYHRARPLHQPK